MVPVSPASHPSIPRIRIRDIHGYISEFTGVLVDTAANRDFALVATVAHSFAAEPKSVEVIVSPTEVYSATVEHVDHVWDIAILSIPKPTARAFQFATTRPAEGQRFYVGGYPNGGKLAWGRGLFVGWAGPVGDYPYEWLRVGVATTHGQSGGPILDAASRLVGLISHGDEETSGPTYWHIQAAIAVVLSGAGDSLPPVVPEPEESGQIAELRAEIALLRALIANIQVIHGEDGEDGQDGTSPTIDVKAITAAIMAGTEEELVALAKALGPIHVRRLDVATNEEKVEEIHLREGFTILNFPPE